MKQHKLQLKPSYGPTNTAAHETQHPESQGRALKTASSLICVEFQGQSAAIPWGSGFAPSHRVGSEQVGNSRKVASRRSTDKPLLCTDISHSYSWSYCFVNQCISSAPWLDETGVAEHGLQRYNPFGNWSQFSVNSGFWTHAPNSKRHSALSLRKTSFHWTPVKKPSLPLSWGSFFDFEDKWLSADSGEIGNQMPPNTSLIPSTLECSDVM